MSLNLNGGEVVTLAEARQYIRNFRIIYPNEIKASFASKEIILQILEQEDCVGIRIYNGYDNEEKRLCNVLVGVNSKEQDMTNGIIVERLRPCPPLCDLVSPLYNV